jgi:transposase
MSRFRPIDRQTDYLLPPSVQEWLPETHLARYVVDVVEALDLSALERAYAGRGSDAYHPAMLLSLLIYGYATGTHSSRRIERATYDSLAFRFIACNQHPDHDTLASFRRRFGEQFAELFVQVLQVARENQLSDVLEFILEIGESSFTTGLVAGVLMAHPNLVTEKMLSLFKCPQFFADDIARYVGEASSLAIHGGHDGLDADRQNERIASNKLPHRKQHLEMLVLQLQIIRPDLRESIFAILDKCIEDLKNAQDVSDGWRMGLKRMDARGMKLGEPVDDGKYVPLEITNLAACRTTPCKMPHRPRILRA